MVLDSTANFVRETTTESVDSTQTSITVSDASAFVDPSASGETEYNVVMWDADNNPRPDEDANAEIMRVTAIDTGTNTLTVTRGQEGTSGASHPNGAAVMMAPTAKMFDDVPWSLSSITSGDSPYDASDGEIIVADASSGAITINVPSPGADVQFAVKVSDATNDVTVSRSGTENIDGDASDDTLSVEDTSRTYISDGTDWFVRAFDPFAPPAQVVGFGGSASTPDFGVGSQPSSGIYGNFDDLAFARNGNAAIFITSPLATIEAASGATLAFARQGSGASTDLEILSDGHIQLGTPNIELEATTETNDGMTADPETATEDAYWTVKIGSTEYQIPLYSA